MKWGRKKPSSAPNKPSLFSSWLSKLKKIGTNDHVLVPESKTGHDHDYGHVKEKGRSNGGALEGQDGALWRRCVVGSVLDDGGLRSSFGRKEESLMLRDVVFSVKVKELPEEEKKEIEIKTPRKGSAKEMRFRSNHRRVLEERLSKLEEEEETQSTKTVQKHVLETEPKLSNGQQKLKELKLKTEKHRKSYYITRELDGRIGSKQPSKIRVYSPRTPKKSEICKIKALEDLKRARSKTKKKPKETTVLESLAVVKCSVDPEKDFRDSMMEMILEESISKPEELEELLACYLTLNADEYHDLIIKVFRQVWLELNEACVQSEIHEEDCCYG